MKPEKVKKRYKTRNTIFCVVTQWKKEERVIILLPSAVGNVLQKDISVSSNCNLQGVFL